MLNLEYTSIGLVWHFYSVRYQVVGHGDYPITDRDLTTSNNKIVPSYLKVCPIMKRMGQIVYDSRRRIFIGELPI